MDQNYITLEMTFRLQMMDYRLVLGMKRAWILALVLGIAQICAWLVKEHAR